MPLLPFRGPIAAPGENRYERERRLIAVHPLTEAVLRHGRQTLRALTRARSTPGVSTVSAAALDDLEFLSYRLAAKTHRLVADVVRLKPETDEDAWGPRRDLEVTGQVIRSVLDAMCQAWTTVFLEGKPDDVLMMEMRTGLAEVEAQLTAVLSTSLIVPPPSSTSAADVHA